MKKVLLLLVLSCGIIINLQAQSIEDLKESQADKQGMIDDMQSKIEAAQSDIDALQKEIDILSGWRKGISGVVGFDWNRSNGWIGNPNPYARSSNLAIDITGYIMNDNDQTFWHNKANIVKAWSDLDISTDDTTESEGLFKNGTVDLLNISSLAGYKISDNLAASGQAELNTSIENFIKPGTFDIGLGVTWLPIENMTVMFHPLNYNVAFPAVKDYSTSGSLGCKIRVDYFTDFVIAGKDVNWTTTLGTYIPYTKVDDRMIPDANGVVQAVPVKVNNYTWINNFSFEVWRGIGVGVGWGLRKADFESEDLQSYTNLGLSYKIK